jgi:hypothetical protein
MSDECGAPSPNGRFRCLAPAGHDGEHVSGVTHTMWSTPGPVAKPESPRQDDLTELAPIYSKLSFGVAGVDFTIEQIRDALTRLGNADPEKAHGMEDDLARAVLAAIRDGHPDPRGLARDALPVLDAEYPGWFA